MKLTVPFSNAFSLAALIPEIQCLNQILPSRAVCVLRRPLRLEFSIIKNIAILTGNYIHYETSVILAMEKIRELMSRLSPQHQQEVLDLH